MQYTTLHCIANVLCSWNYLPHKNKTHWSFSCCFFKELTQEANLEKTSVKQSRHWNQMSVYLRSDMLRCWGICIDDVGVEGDSLHSLRSVVTCDTDTLLSVSRLPPWDVSALLSPRCHNIGAGVRIRAPGRSLSVSVTHRSQSIDLSRGILKTSEFGELINTRAFSSFGIPEKMRTDRHFAACSPKN